MEQAKNYPTVESIRSDIKALPEKDFLNVLSKLFGESPLPAALTSFESKLLYADG